jgi:hypothetical protein
MMIKLSNNIKYLILILLIISLILFINHTPNYELFIDPTQVIVDSKQEQSFDDYIQSFKEKKNRMFPFRYFTDINNNVLPFVAVTGFFRGEDAKNKYYEYINKGIHVFGITAYKSFPNKEMLDESEGEYERNDDFDYTGNIKHWLCCFKDKQKYGFTDNNNITDISESDFYNVDTDIKMDKKYDFIYICNKDGDSCPLNGWNAINRNYNLALKCFPIMINEFKLKGLIVGRINCGLEELYGDNLEVVDFLDWHILQDKMRQSKMLFVPNIFDASPRVIAECIIKDTPILMNHNILCGFKYINYETGNFFSDENDLRQSLSELINKMDKISPKKWWGENYSQEKCYKKLRNFLMDAFNKNLDNIDQVKFIL